MADTSGSKWLEIAEGNLVLLCDHPEGHKKSKTNRSEEFVVVGKYSEPNVYPIKPGSGNGPVETVNQHQLQDLGKNPGY